MPSIRQKSISSIFFSLENDTLDKIYLACNVLTVDNFLFPTLIAWNEIFLLLKTKLQMCKLWFMFLLFFISSFFYKIFGWETHFTTHYIKQSLQYLLNNISKLISNIVRNYEYIFKIFHKQYRSKSNIWNMNQDFLIIRPYSASHSCFWILF